MPDAAGDGIEQHGAPVATGVAGGHHHHAELPGIDPDKDVEITIQDGVLNVHGERREEHKDHQRSEFFYGSFSRSVALPKGADVDDTRASYKDGILEVSVKLVEEKAEVKKISVTAAK